MNEDKLREVCYMLAQDLMWGKDTVPIEQIPEYFSELTGMTNRFMEIAHARYYQVEDLPNSEDILLGAIKYLNAQAIPPLKGNYTWFNDSLSTLLEICNPNSCVGRDGLPFLFSLQKGVIQLLEWAIKPDEQ